MSERAPQAQPFDPLEAARLDAAGPNPGQAIYYEFMGKPGEVDQQAAGDFVNYLENRPKVESDGHTRDSIQVSDRELKASDKYHDDLRYLDYLDTREKKAEKKSMNELIEDWAKAEDAEDKTKANDAQDEIMNRLEKEDKLSDDHRVKLIDTIYNKKESLRKGNAKVDGSSKVDNADGSDSKKGGELVPIDDKKDIEPADKGKGGEIVPIEEAPHIKYPIDESPAELLPADMKEIESPEYQELAKKLNETRDEFIRLSAKRRGVSTFGHGKKLEAAKKAYEEARDEAGAWTAEYFEKQGLSKEDIDDLAILARGVEVCNVTKAIMDRQVESTEGKKLKGFYDWWAKQGGHKLFSKAGIKGAAKKMAAMGALGFVPGVVAGAAGTALLGPVAGGLIGAAVARGVARGLMGARIEKNAMASTVAREQARTQVTNDARRLSGNTDLSTAAVTEGIQDLTERSVARNRKRMAGSIAVGAAMGTLGAAVGGHIFHHGGGGNHTPKGNRPSGPRHAGGARPRGPVHNPAEDVAKLNHALDEQARQMMSVEGKYPWDRATAIYGEKGGQRLIDAVSKLQSRGANVRWVGDPISNPQHAYIMFDGHSDTNYVWGHLTRTLAEQNFDRFAGAE